MDSCRITPGLLPESVHRNMIPTTQITVPFCSSEFSRITFLLGTAMIIYYKQISEGYEDQNRFEIMQKVGLSHREVKSSIRRQILMVFFLPLLMAMLHISMAFPLIRRMLLLFGMTNTRLFIGCTAGTVLIFALVYGLIYLMTAKSYYHIVERR